MMPDSKKIIRVIQVFDKTTDQLVKKIILNNQKFKLIKNIIVAYEGDINYYEYYEIKKRHYNTTVMLIPVLQKYPLRAFEIYFGSQYILE